MEVTRTLKTDENGAEELTHISVEFTWLEYISAIVSALHNRDHELGKDAGNMDVLYMESKSGSSDSRIPTSVTIHFTKGD